MGIRVFRVSADDAFASVRTVDTSRSLDDEIVSYHLKSWEPPALELLDDGKTKGNFYGAGRSALVFDQEALSGLLSLFDAAGELFSLEVDGAESLHLLNVREICNALGLDEQRST